MAAALAAGVLTTQAQNNVYSVNIVGYVNQDLPTGALKMIQNPLDDSTNTLNSVLGSAPNQSVAYFWTGSGYTSSTKGKAGWNPDLAVPTGTGMFISPGGDSTNTFVGQTVGGPGEAVTNSLLANQLTLTGSLLPYGATLNSTNGLGLDAAPNQSVIYQWNGAGYTSSTKGKAGWNPDLSVGVGESFFINAAADFDWIQALPAN